MKNALPWGFGPAALVLVSLVRADAQPDLLADDLISDIGTARIADEAGDDTLLNALQGKIGRQACLTALRAAPHAYAPERLWPALFAQSCGRDPTFAPEAAAALQQLEERLRISDFAAREVLRADITAAREALACSKENAAPRADIAAAQAQFIARVDVLLRELAVQ